MLTVSVEHDGDDGIGVRGEGLDHVARPAVPDLDDPVPARGRDPLTASIESGPCDQRRGKCTIVGVVSDAALGAMRAGLRPSIYVPLAQSAGFGPAMRTTIALSLRTAADSPASLAPGVADALTSLDRRLSFSSRPLEEDVKAALTQERLLAILSSFFGGLALLLSALGLYGMTAHAAARRRGEIGIRLALGATRMHVIRVVLLRTLTVTGAGTLAGVAASVWASRSSRWRARFATFPAPSDASSGMESPEESP